MPSWSQKIEARTFPADFCTRNFLGGVSRYAATPLIVALSPGHSDITRFRPWSPIAPDRKSFGSRRKNSKSCSDGWHRWRFWSAFRHFGTHFAEGFRMSKSSRMMDPTRPREMPSCSAIDLVEIWRTTTYSPDWKNNWKVTIFRLTRRSSLPRRPGLTNKFLIFFEWLTKFRATG